MTAIRVLGISGSLRRDSFNTSLLRAAATLVPEGMALFGRLTGSEYLNFVGRMYGLDRQTAAKRTAELLVQDAQFGLSYIAARQSEAQAESAARMAATAHRLNVIAALFLPLTAVASVLGMDIHSGLSDTQENFLLVVAASVGFGLVFALMVRKKG